MPKVLINELDSAEKGVKVTEVELVYRNKGKASERPVVTSAGDAYDLLLKTWDMGKIELQEQFRVLLLDHKHSCLAVSTVATGGLSSCAVDLKTVFAMALKASAAAVILAHNHPSGSTTASEADKTLTAQFVRAGKVLSLPVLDHLIVTREGYTSFADDGMMFHAP